MLFRSRRAGVHEVRPGDIVLTRFGESVRLHRLAGFHGGKSRTKLITRGDNHSWDDSPCPANHLLGVLVRIEGKPPLLDRCRIRARQLARVLARDPA